MKRSEIVKIISDHCKDNLNISSSFDRYRLMAADILLHKLEEVGIFPPILEEESLEKDYSFIKDMIDYEQAKLRFIKNKDYDNE